MIEDILSDIEKAKIIQFNEDKVLSEAVKKVMLQVLYTQGTLRKDLEPKPLSNAAFGLVFQTLPGKVVTDEQLGQDLRGLAHGVNLLEGGFERLASITRKEEPKAVEENPAV